MNILGGIDAYSKLAILVILLAGGGLTGLAGLKIHGARKDNKMNARLAAMEEGTDRPEQETPDIFEPTKKDRGGVTDRITVNSGSFLLILIGSFLMVAALWIDMLFGLGLFLVSVGIALLLIRNRLKVAFSRRVSGQFPEALDLFVRGARVGVSVEENMKVVASEMSEPLSVIFALMSEQMAIGQSFEQVLIGAAEKYPLREFRYLAATLTMQRKTGGQYADILETLSKLLREQQEQRARTHAMTSESRLAAKIIAGLVVSSCVSLFFLNREQFDFLLEDNTGTSILLYCLTSLAVGFLVMHWQISRVR